MGQYILDIKFSRMYVPKAKCHLKKYMEASIEMLDTHFLKYHEAEGQGH